MNNLVLRVAFLLCLIPTITAAGSWDIQFAEPFALDRKVAMMDLDLDSVPADTIRTLTAQGVQVICYVSVGTAETYRADYTDFPKAVVGKNWPDWPDEYFLDIRQIDVLLPIMQARFQRCKDAGAVGIDPDNQDQQWAGGGFKITKADAVAYMKALAQVAHGMGLTIGQKNNTDTLRELVGTLDFIVTEDCYQDGWCAEAAPYAAAGKPVYAIEYTDYLQDWPGACAEAAKLGLSMILKDRDLNGAAFKACP